MKPRQIDPEKISSSSKRVMSGVAAVGVLLSATAVINVLKRALSLSPSHWLDAFLAAYTRLMHPIVDAVIGWIPHLVGFELLPATKDVMILYAAMGAIVSRGASAVYRRHGNWAKWNLVNKSILDAILWPKTLLLMVLRVTAFRLLKAPEMKSSLDDYEDDQEGMNALMYQMQKGLYLFERASLRDIWTEVLFTGAIVLCAVVANEAELLS